MTPRPGRRIVLVTGASSGVGAAVVQRLTTLDCTVYALLRAIPEAPSFAANVLLCDIDDDNAVRAMFARIAGQTGGRLDGVIHCAATSAAGPVETTLPQELRVVLETNVLGTFSLIRHGLPLLRKSGGRLIVVSSLSGRVSMPMQGAYCASKAAIEALLDTLRREIAGSGVTVSILQPGGIRTRMAELHAQRIAARMATLSGIEADHYDALLRAHQRLVAQGREMSIPPDAVVDPILHALESPRPRIRYRVGKDARLLLALWSILPDRWMDRLILGMHRPPRGR